MKLVEGPEHRKLWGSLNTGVVGLETVDETPIPTALFLRLLLPP